jgi:ribonucleoside-diphosphate reductase alpha chain
MRTPSAVFDIADYEHAVRLWTMVLEVSVMMAQFPSRQIAELSYEYRTLGLGYANIGGLLMTSGIPYDSEGRPRDLRRADRDHDRRCLCHLGGDGRRARPLPRLQGRTKNMLRVIRNHRRAAHGEAAAMRTCRSAAGAAGSMRIAPTRT